MFASEDKEIKLIKSCIQGDKRSQRELYEQFSRTMFAICLRYAPDYKTAEDYLQDGFIKVYANLTRYEGKGSFEGWMKRIFINTCLETIRKNDLLRNAENVDEAYALFDSSESVIERLSAEDIIGLIQSLPQGYRTVFNLYAIEGYDHREIAQQLNINESTSRSQYVRARQLLQIKIRELFNQ